MDAQGHVNNAIFLDYLQETRVQFLLTGGQQLQDLLGTGVLVVTHQVEYLAPVPFDGSPVFVELWVDSVGASRFVIGYEIFHRDVLVGRARTSGAPFDLAGSGLRRLRPAERDGFQAWLHPATPLRAVAKGRIGPNAHRYPLRVRWSELDSYGHVNNVKFYEYVQEARIALLHEAVDFPAEEIWVVARQDLEYLRPLDFRLQPYEVATAVTAVGSRSVTLEVAIRDPVAQTIYATARTVLVGERPVDDQRRERLGRWASA